MTTQRGRASHGIKDRVQRHFERSRANELWVADTTHLPVRGGHAFLAVAMDVCTRQVSGCWAYGERQDTRVMLGSLRMAASQGSQYASRAYHRACRLYGIVSSMGSVGECYNNAMVESWFATMKREL